MIQSMTGYGAHSISSSNFKISVELKSLNSKFLEINMKIPKNYIQHEISLRNALTVALDRGKVNAILEVEVLNPEKNRLNINRDLVKAYAHELESLRLDLGLEKGPSLEYILSLPDSMNSGEGKEDPEEWGMIETAFREATAKLKSSRNEEGKALEADLRLRIQLISSQLSEVVGLLPGRIEGIRNRILQNFLEVQERINVDTNRFEQELIYYIERLDVTEEIVRLKKHLEYFGNTLAEKEGNGKKLGFISQEIGREINTIGSKANDAEIQMWVVRMKDELEKIKEQLNNIV